MVREAWKYLKDFVRYILFAQDEVSEVDEYVHFLEAQDSAHRF